MEHKAYGAIGKHIFIAYKIYSESEDIIIIADSIEAAQVSANKYFGYSEESGKTFVAVHGIQQTENMNVFTIEDD